PDHMNRNAFAEGDGKQRQDALLPAVHRKLRGRSVIWARTVPLPRAKPAPVNMSERCKLARNNSSRIFRKSSLACTKTLPRDTWPQGIMLAHGICREAPKLRDAQSYINIVSWLISSLERRQN
ncbi:MAG: hypothetical protein ACREDH_13220, partial [Methylocella sp.]